MVFLFKVKIEGLSKPPVWRKIAVPASFDFVQLSDVIQIVFGWSNSHLWQFAPRIKRGFFFPAFYINEPYDEDEFDGFIPTLFAAETRLDKIFPDNKELVYTYDFGDGWKHSIKLEGIVDEESEFAVCIGGKGSTPPEDCGGARVYEEMKDAFAERNKKAMAYYREWLGFEDDEDWDPNFFCAEELKDINLALKSIKASGNHNQPSLKDGNFVSIHASNPHYYSVQELLKSKTKPELCDIALALGFRLKSGVKKDLMLNDLAKMMLSEPERIIKGAFHYELKAFLDIIKGNMSVEYAEMSELLFALNRFGMIYALEYRNGRTSTLHLQMDIADVLEPLIPAELERRERDGSLLFEKLALGCANIYGFTEMYYLHKYYPMVEKRIGHKLDEEALNRAFSPILGVLLNGKPYEEDMFFSPFAQMVSFSPHNEEYHRFIDAKGFDLDTILSYGEMPYPRFDGKEAEALRKIFSKYGKEGVDSEYFLREVWLAHQGKDKTPLETIGFLNINNKSAIQSCLEAITNFSNNVPCWTQRGYSSSEAYAKEIAAKQGQRPRISIGKNLKTLGINSFEQLMSMDDDENAQPQTPFVSSVKVGRNDPCPCGSGKKYKHCCGRNR